MLIPPRKRELSWEVASCRQSSPSFQLCKYLMCSCRGSGPVGVCSPLVVYSPARESRHTGRRQPDDPWSLHVIKSLAGVAAGTQGLFQALDVALPLRKDPWQHLVKTQRNCPCLIRVLPITLGHKQDVRQSETSTEERPPRNEQGCL